MEDNSTKPKFNRYHKAKYTQQDFRQKAIEARDELQANVDFLVEVIREDRYHLKRYKERFGDLRYRPIVTPEDRENAIEPIYGNPTDLALEPLASKYRATIKSLLDSIKLINSEIITEDNPEGESTIPSDEAPKRQSLRDEFKAMGKDSKAFTAPVPTEDEELSEDESEALVSQVRQGLADAKAGRTKTSQQTKTIIESPKSNTPKSQSWRDTTPSKPTPRLVPRQKPDVEEEPKKPLKSKLEEAMEDSQPKGLSPMMRARLAGMGSNRMDAIKKRISTDEDDGEDEA
jgi:hypothetical protein